MLNSCDIFTDWLEWKHTWPRNSRIFSKNFEIIMYLKFLLFFLKCYYIKKMFTLHTCVPLHYLAKERNSEVKGKKTWHKVNTTIPFKNRQKYVFKFDLNICYIFVLSMFLPWRDRIQELNRCSSIKLTK